MYREAATVRSKLIHMAGNKGDAQGRAQLAEALAEDMLGEPQVAFRHDPVHEEGPTSQGHAARAEA